MTKIIILTIGLILFLGCSERKERITRNNESSFNLDRDILNFSEKMCNGDTILLNAKMCVCAAECEEYNKIFKENDSVYIQSVYVEKSPRNYTKTIKKTFYKYEKTDTLNLENLLTSIRNNRTRRNYYIKYTYQTIYKNDTIEFFTYGLVSTLKKMMYYHRIKERIFPNEELYKPIEAPAEER